MGGEGKGERERGHAGSPAWGKGERERGGMQGAQHGERVRERRHAGSPAWGKGERERGGMQGAQHGLVMGYSRSYKGRVKFIAKFLQFQPEVQQKFLISWQQHVIKNFC